MWVIGDCMGEGYRSLIYRNCEFKNKVCGVPFLKRGSQNGGAPPMATGLIIAACHCGCGSSRVD